MARADGMDLLSGFEGQGQQALSGLSNLNSSFSGIDTAADAKTKYGIKDTSSVFAPLFKSLAANKANRLRGSFMRAGRSASPEMTFSNVESDYEDNLNKLLGQQGQADIGQQQFVANLLGNAQGARDRFGLSKFGQMGQQASTLFGNRMNLEQFNREGEGPSFGDIFGSVLGAGAKVAGAAAGAPRSTFNF